MASRLTFTSVTQTDRSLLEACWDDDDMRRYLGGAMPLEKRDRIFQTFVASGWCWVQRLRDGTAVGTGTVVDTDGTKELGIELIESAPGVGLGREACEAMLDRLAKQGVGEVMAIVQRPTKQAEGSSRRWAESSRHGTRSGIPRRSSTGSRSSRRWSDDQVVL